MRLAKVGSWGLGLLIATASAFGAEGVTLRWPQGQQRVLGQNLTLDYCLRSTQAADAYAAVLTPEANALFFQHAAPEPSFTTTVAPFLAATPAAPDEVCHTLLDAVLPDDLPTGTYTFYAAAVAPGANVFEPGQWLGGTYAEANLMVLPPAAFFYQTVNPSLSMTRAGATLDGVTVSAYDTAIVAAKEDTVGRGDPVLSYRAAAGRWSMTAKGNGSGSPLLYAEGNCPQVDTTQIKTLAPSSASGCLSGSIELVMGKTSQLFAGPGGEYLLSQTGGEIYLLRLADTADAARIPLNLESICVRQTPVTTLAELAWSEATRVISKAQAGNLLLSDAAIAQRTDGTWVLFTKGIDSTVNAGCRPASLCELCARGIYRATSTDLINWSALTPVVTQASVPDAVRYADGTIWLYYQDFAPTCAAQNLNLALRAPISGVAEQADGSFSAQVSVLFPGASFEIDANEHYPTNGNPVALPDTAAWNAFRQCVLAAP